MASWRHYGRSLRSFWSTSLAAELEYPLNAVIELVSVFGNLAGSLFVLQLLFAGGSSLGGWSWNGALVVLGMAARVQPDVVRENVPVLVATGLGKRIFTRCCLYSQ